MARGERTPDGARIRGGLILIALLTLGAAAVFFLDVAARATAEGRRITVHTPAAPGLRPGSAVWIAGRPVGRVLSVDFRPPGSEGGTVAIRAVLDRGVERFLRADAAAEVRAADLLEAVVVAIDPGSPDAPPLESGRPIGTVRRPIDRGVLLALADTLLQAGRRLADRAAVTRSALTDPSSSLARLRADRAAIEELRAELERLGVLLRRDLARGTLARLAADTTVMPAAARLQERLDALAASPGRAGAERAAASLAEALEGLEARVTAISRHLDEGRGTAGRALVDGELARQLEALREGVRALIADLLLDPSRWLRARIF